MEESRKGGGGEDSVSCREEGAGMGAEGVGTGGKGGKMKQAPPCDHTGRGGEEEDFGAMMEEWKGDQVSMGDLSPGRALCVRAEGKE